MKKVVEEAKLPKVTMSSKGRPCAKAIDEPRERKKTFSVLRQDCVLWRLENPSHGIFKDEPHGGNLFTDSEFLAFEQILLETMRTQESPQEIKIKDVMPDLSNVLNALSN